MVAVSRLAGDRVFTFLRPSLRISVSVAHVWDSDRYFVCYHIALSRVYKISIVCVVSLRVCSSPQQTQYFTRIIALAEISTTTAIDRLQEWTCGMSSIRFS